jgi:uncharacterized protein (DUF2141 family)
MKVFILTALLVLFAASAYAGVTRQTITNKSGTVVARSYTDSKGYTTYKDNRGNTLGFSRETTMGGKPATRIMAKDGTYRGVIANGLVRDNSGKIQGAVKNTTPSNSKGKK